MSRPFRLQAVARLRESARDAARARLAEALRAEEVLEDRGLDLERRFKELIEQRRVASESADTAWLLNAGRYELVLRGDQQELTKNVAAIEAEIQRRRDHVADAEREVRALELLKERAEKRKRAEEAKRAARRLDEFASQAVHVGRSQNHPLS